MKNTRSMRTDERLTEEQEELRQRGLLLLARIIARRHLASLAHDRGTRPSAPHADDPSGSPTLQASGRELPIEEEDDHAR